VLIDHFENYPLITQKFADYKLFKQAFELIKSKQHLSPEGLRKIVAIKASLNLGLSPELKSAFPDIIPVPRPIVVHQEIQDPNWLAGFTSGEGCFLAVIGKATTLTGYKVELRFIITQSARDVKLMKSLTIYLDCGFLQLIEKENKCKFVISKFLDNFEKIIPFFNKYPILGVKSKDFQDFYKIAYLMKEKKHLTSEGLERIRKIKAGMNKGRELL
jgi:hypothetical protein